MFQPTQALHPVPTVFGAGFIAPRFENGPPSKLVDDRETLFKEFVKRLRALVWSEQAPASEPSLSTVISKLHREASNAA